MDNHPFSRSGRTGGWHTNRRAIIGIKGDLYYRSKIEDICLKVRGQGNISIYIGSLLFYLIDQIVYLFHDFLLL